MLPLTKASSTSSLVRTLSVGSTTIFVFVLVGHGQLHAPGGKVVKEKKIPPKQFLGKLF